MTQHFLDSLPQTTSIAEIAAKFGNVHHFRKALNEREKHIVPAEFINWSYVFQIVKGEKKLIDLSELDGFTMLPK